MIHDRRQRDDPGVKPKPKSIGDLWVIDWRHRMLYKDEQISPKTVSGHLFHHVLLLWEYKQDTIGCFHRQTQPDHRIPEGREPKLHQLHHDRLPRWIWAPWRISGAFRSGQLHFDVPSSQKDSNLLPRAPDGHRFKQLVLLLVLECWSILLGVDPRIIKVS